MNVLYKFVCDFFHVSELQAFFVDIILAHGIVEGAILQVENCSLTVDLIVTDTTMAKEVFRVLQLGERER